MASVLTSERWCVNWGAFICFIYLVYADESMTSPGVSGEYYQLGTRPRFWDHSETVQHVQLKNEEDSLFFQIILSASKLTKSQYPDGTSLYRERSLKCHILLPNATLMICFSIVLGYMAYIVIALMLKPVQIEDHMNPLVKVLLSDKAFSDSIIPPKLRGLYGELESGSCETVLGLQKTDIPTADGCSSDENEKSVADQLFSSAT